MCLPFLFFFSAPLIRWPEAELKTLTAIGLRAYKNTWNISRSTAACLLTFPKKNMGLQVKLLLVTLCDSMWGNLERYYQFDYGTRQMMKLAYQEVLTDNACANLLELQKEAGVISWEKTGENKFTFACHLAKKLEIEVLWDPFNEYTISAAPKITLATLSIRARLQLRIQILGVQASIRCSSMDKAGLLITVSDQVNLNGLQIDGQARCPGLQSLREAIATTYRTAIWLAQWPSLPSAGPAAEEVDDRLALGASSGEDTDEVKIREIQDDQAGVSDSSDEEQGSPDMPTKGWTGLKTARLNDDSHRVIRFAAELSAASSTSVRNSSSLMTRKWQTSRQSWWVSYSRVPQALVCAYT